MEDRTRRVLSWWPVLPLVAAIVSQSSPIPTDLLLRLEYDVGYPEWLALLAVGRSQPDS
jgi:hypothetical protein